MAVLDFPVVEPVENVAELWGVDLQPAGCSACGQAHLMVARWIGKWCPNCGRGRLQSQPALLRQELPEKMIPFQFQGERLRTLFAAFTKDVWLRPDDFDPAVLAGRAVPVFWPMWLVDADVSGAWQAEVGYDYQVKSSQESYNGGGWQTRELVETRVRWEPRAGSLTRHYDNVPVLAHDDHEQLTRLIGPYDHSRLIDYAPQALGEAVLRVPDLQPESVWPQAEQNVEKACAADCQQAAGGQHIRQYSIHARYHDLYWTQLLQPMYVSYYTDDEGQAHLVYVNGQTGAVGGQRMASQRKGWLWGGVALAAALLLLALGSVSLMIGAVAPPLAVLGGLLIVLGLVLGALAIAPIVWPWQWNSRQRETYVYRADEKRQAKA